MGGGGEAGQQHVERDFLLKRMELAISQSEALRRELRQVLSELDAVHASSAWRWGLHIQRFRQELTGGSWPERGRYLRHCVRRVLRLRADSPEPRKPAWFAASLRQWLSTASESPSDWLFFIYASSGFIQEQRGHRFHQIALELGRRGVPVFYSYYPWGPEEAVPKPTHPLLFQSPTWLTSQVMPEVARYQLGRKKRVFLVGLPVSECAQAIGELSSLGWLTHYDCMDDWQEFRQAGAAPWYSASAERMLACSADVVTATAAMLVEKMQRFAPGRIVHLSPNALDSSFLRPELCGRIAPRSGRLIVGYVGHLGQWWFDWEGLKTVARSLPEAEFQIIGFGGPEQLELPANVRLLGARNHAQIREIARRWRAALIPFKISPLSDAVDPLKVYEYLAMGLPVVCFDMSQIRDYPYVYSASDPASFADQIRHAAAAPMDRAVIDSFLARNRWENRVDQYLELAEAALSATSPVRGLQAAEELTSR